MSSNSEQPGHPEPAPSTYALLRRSATSLRADASLLEAVVSLKGDEDGALARFARERRELASACERRAKQIGPPPKALENWERGQREAMKGWNPAGWRDVPVLGANEKKD